MKKPVPITREFSKGLWDNNPALIQLLGLCPVLAVQFSAAVLASKGCGARKLVINTIGAKRLKNGVIERHE